jgi:ligand-binding sensor domain-containing protein
MPTLGSVTKRLCGCLAVPVLLALLAPFVCVAGLGFPPANPSYGVDFWREAEGLPQSRVRAIVQTHDGYIWLGTDGGAVRFNGASFRAFTVETGSLKDNEVWALQEDDENALWIGTFGGGLTRLKDGRFRTFSTSDGLPDDVVTHIEKDSSGDLWIATSSGFCRYSHGRFTRIEAPGSPTVAGRDTICALSPGGVFVSTGSQVFHLSEGRFEPPMVRCGSDSATARSRTGRTAGSVRSRRDTAQPPRLRCSMKTPLAASGRFSGAPSTVCGAGDSNRCPWRMKEPTSAPCTACMSIGKAASGLGSNPMDSRVCV